MDEAEKKARRTMLAGWTKVLSTTYREMVGVNPLPQATHEEILLAYEDRLTEVALARLRGFYHTRRDLLDRTRERAQKDVLWRQPVVLCVYPWVQFDPAGTKDAWPLAIDELAPFYDDLGIEIPSS